MSAGSWEYDDGEQDLRAEVARLRKENAALKKREAERAPTAKSPSGAKKGKFAREPSAADVKKALASLFTQVKRNVKKQGHTWQKKPRAEAATAVWTEDVWNAATEGLQVTGKVVWPRRGVWFCFAKGWRQTTKKVTVPPAVAVKQLGWDAAIHPVKFTGKMFMPIGINVPGPYCFAGYDSIVLSFVPKTGLVTAKVRTFLAATGNADVEATVAQIAAQYN